MASVNKVILVGNLGGDPEIRYTQNARVVCNFSLATSESYQDKQGIKHTNTEWHRVAVWGNQAEACAKHLNKGSTVYVEGSLTTRKWEKDGVTHYTTSINATKVTFLGLKKDKNSTNAVDDSPPSDDESQTDTASDMI